MWKIFEQLTRSRHHRSFDVNSVLEMLNVASDCFLIVDHEGTILYANHKASLQNPMLIQGQSVFTALRSPTLKEMFEELQETDKNHLQNEMTLHYPSTCTFKVSLMGFDTHRLLHLQDITLEKQALQRHGDFVANVSHELRTPLASICGFIETLQTYAKDDPAATEQFLSIMAAQAKRMNHLINSLLSLSKIELDQHILPKTVCDLTQVVQNVALAMQPLMKEKNMIFDVVIDPDKACLIWGCSDQIFQIFQNLIENAIKYSNPDKTIHIHLDAQAEYWRVHIEDEGYGIAPEHLPRLTERFYRIDEARHRSEGGAGLGLSIVGTIIERHHGRLEITSEKGKGSCFQVLLPIKG